MVSKCHQNFRFQQNPHTVFIRIVAVATINFSLAWMWLLIKGGSYSRVALTRDTHQCRKFLAQPAIRHVASLVLVHWNRNGISRVCDLTAVFAIDHAPVKLHSDWLHAAEPMQALFATLDGA